MVDWIIGIGVAVLVVLIIRQQFRKKRNGQSGQDVLVEDLFNSIEE